VAVTQSRLCRGPAADEQPAAMSRELAG